MHIKHLIIICILFLIATIIPCKNSKANGFDNFITSKGNKLMNGDKVFRFVSYNVPTLNYTEDEFEFTQLAAYALPTEYELRDIFETVKQMGGKVVRLYTIPARIASEPAGTPTYVLGPNKFSEEAFIAMDLVLALANEYNVRIVFSLLNNWQWMGGRPQYVDFRGKKSDEFWTDRQLIDDFKATVDFTLNRKNTITGILYKDDKAIMCWETGNELTCPLEWTIEICRYIKSIDKNHLILDGYHAIDGNPVREGSILEPSIDIIHSHHYETNPADFITNVDRNIKLINGRKPYIIGEFGFVGTPAIEQYIDKILDSDIAGMMIWGLRGHREKGGFYWHSEPLGFGRYKSYHWPGFASGNEYDETNLMAIMQQKAFEIDGKSVPKLPIPKMPELLPIENVGNISWKGSAGANFYDLYRSSSANGPWDKIGYNLNDASNQYFALYNDRTAEIGNTYYYQLTAKNRSGESAPSKTVGPVKVNTKVLVDDMENFGNIYFSSRSITLETSNDRMFKEDMYRIKGNKGEEIVYFAPGKISGIMLYSYCTKDTVNISFEISNDANKYTPIEIERLSYNNGSGGYGYWVPISYSIQNEINAQFIKVKFNTESQLSRMEIFYK